jgi:subtilisin family serine protease
MSTVSRESQALTHFPHKGDTRTPLMAHNTSTHMLRVGSVRRSVTAALAVLMVVPSFGTAWTGRTPSFTSHIDPSLSAGEVALVQTSVGHAGALSLKLAQLGAVDVQTDSAVNMVIARLSAPALAAIAADPTVITATHDTAIVATGDRTNNWLGFEDDDPLATTSTSAYATSLLAIRAPYAWTRSTGEGVTVAILDTGIADHPDLGRRKVKARVDFVHDGNSAQDPGGHGTFIAGVIAANGHMKGVAPDASLVSLRVLDANGNGTVANVVGAFDWLLKNSQRYQVDVVNLSWGAPQATSYHKDILSALVESLWFEGMTVVAAAGNGGPTAGTVTAPGADPFVVTVGSFADQGTTAFSDDRESTFSSRGPTLDGFTKPDTLAPGEHVQSLRVAGVSYLDKNGVPAGEPTDVYVRMTGTSAAAAFVSGVAALVASDHKRFSPTQIKGAIVASGRPITGSSTKAVDALLALSAMTSVNVGLKPSALLIQILLAARALRVKGVTWEGVTWDGITWDGITWEAINWHSVSWESVSWETITWEGVTWAKVIAK